MTDVYEPLPLGARDVASRGGPTLADLSARATPAGTPATPVAADAGLADCVAVPVAPLSATDQRDIAQVARTRGPGSATTGDIAMSGKRGAVLTGIVIADYGDRLSTPLPGASST